MNPRFVYRHIYVYRAAMNLLYAGGYRARFRDVTALFGSDVRSVCDLCFGDTVIAQWCRSRDIRWTGVDINHAFCSRARRSGFEVLEGDVFEVALPRADVFVMAGSLYHFHDQLSRLFDAVLSCTSRFIISEPVRNLSARAGALGWWARQLANPGNGHAVFRYDEETLLAAIRGQQERRALRFHAVSCDRDMLLEIECSSGTAASPSVC